MRGWRQLPKLALSTLLVLPDPCAASNACDLNGDGVVNAADVQAAINMSLGIAPCTAAVAGKNVCNVVVVQRIVNAWLEGTCLASTGLHVVILRWTASTSAGVTGYNIYRRTELSTYERIASPGNVISYTDTTVLSGVTYYYKITASSGPVESTFTATARVSIPTP